MSGVGWVAGGSMNEVLWVGGHRIDSRSQRILRALRGGDWVYGGELRKGSGPE